MDIFANYLSYLKETESPILYHRWCYLTSLGAILGRQVHVEHGHFRIFSNLFVMLMGEPAARKSTAVKIAKKLLAQSGYTSFASDKTTKEKFLIDLEGVEVDDNPALGSIRSNPTNENLFGPDSSEPREVFIVADEFNEFVRPGDTEFCTTLGNLWDWDSEQPFNHRTKNSRSLSIYQPTISLLSGNTPTLFSRVFPPEAIGSGFLSRLILVHGERTGRRIAFPTAPDTTIQSSLVEYLRKLASAAGTLTNNGVIDKSEEAIEVLTDIYINPLDVNDSRFAGYNQRRFTQLLKLCLILAVAKFKRVIELEDVIQANTILSHAEMLMPKAMGEFGKNKNSDVTHKIMDLLDKTTRPLNAAELFKSVQRDVRDLRELMDIMNSLRMAEKVQVVTSGMAGFLPKKQVRKTPKHVDWDFLTEEEMRMIG